MPTVQDEEESLCLLASDLQDLPMAQASKEAQAASTASNETSKINPDEDWESCDEKSSFLGQGHAEKAFFNVCKTQEEEEDDEDEAEEAMEVMNDIIGTLEADHISAPIPASGASNKKESRNSRSLVVDIHLPPATSEDEDEEMMQPPQPSSCSNIVATSASASSNRPCKHEVNRFQRCYSDGSQSSPKRKSKTKDQLRHSHLSEQLSDAYSMREENLDRIETVICDNEHNSVRITGTKAKKNNNFRGSTISDQGNCSSNVGLLRGAAFGIQQEFMQFKNSLLEGKNNLTENAKQKRKSDSEVYASDSPSPLVKFEINDHEDTEDEVLTKDYHSENPKKSSKFIYPRLNFFGSGLSSSVGDSSCCSVPSAGPQQQQAGQVANCQKSEDCDTKKSPYAFFVMDSEDDFDPYGSDVPSDVDTKRDLLGHSLENQNVDIENGSCLSASSSTVSLPVCRICQLPGVEPSNPLISPCRCLGSIRYVHNNCLLKWLEVSSRRRSGPPCCELCQYQYLRHKKFVISHWRFPECSLRDKFLHFFFIVNVCLMIACAAVTIICFKEVEPVREPIVNRQPHIDLFFQDGVPYRAPNYHASELTVPELITVSCGILFFLAFFMAIYVEVKAKHTVYQLICKFFYMNHEWSVEEYDRKRDIAESRKKKEKESKKHKFRNNRRHRRSESSSSSRQISAANAINS